MKRMPLFEIVTVTIGVVLQVDPVAANGQEPKPADSVAKAWYTPAELLTALAQRDGSRWALPETLSGRALVGNAVALHNIRQLSFKDGMEIRIAKDRVSKGSDRVPHDDPIL